MGEGADVIVVGMGPGSEDLAGKLAEAGLEVVALESNLMGGECPCWGRIPSKRAAGLLAEGRRIRGMAGTATVEPDWAPVAARPGQAADILGKPVDPAAYRALPRVTFTDPDVGSVGTSEEAARAGGMAVRVGRAAVPEASRRWTRGVGNDGLIKVVEDAEGGVLVGALSIGRPGARSSGFSSSASTPGCRPRSCPR